MIVATFDDKSLVDRIIQGQGRFMDDPPVIAVVEYESPSGGRLWAVCYVDADIWGVWSSPYVINPRVIFRRQEDGKGTD